MRICVFLGSQKGRRPEYTEQARKLGHCLAKSNIGLTYGGASVGLMGELARAAADAGGEVVGVIPHRLAKLEIAAEFISDLRFVDTLEERKRLMFELSDAFVALPGGVGTLEELFTAHTWNILRYHDKPVGLLNTRGYYDNLFRLLHFQRAEGFIPRNWLDSLILEEDVEKLIEALRTAADEHTWEKHLDAHPLE